MLFVSRLERLDWTQSGALMNSFGNRLSISISFSPTQDEIHSITWPIAFEWRPAALSHPRSGETRQIYMCAFYTVALLLAGDDAIGVRARAGCAHCFLPAKTSARTSARRGAQMTGDETGRDEPSE